MDTLPGSKFFYLAWKIQYKSGLALRSAPAASPLYSSYDEAQTAMEKWKKFYSGEEFEMAIGCIDLTDLFPNHTVITIDEHFGEGGLCDSDGRQLRGKSCTNK